jgi:leader peptidase (prepilin peptidase)/N-methyltransferase
MGSDGVSLLALTIPVAGVIGLLVGSFLNVVVYRAPLGLSVTSPRSFCPTCDRQLTWWENVPVFSWLGLRGRCRTCHQPISIRYPLVELTTAMIFALVTWAWGGEIAAAAYCCLAATLLAIVLIEQNGKRAPLAVAAFGAAAGQLILVVGAGWEHQWRIVVGSLVGSAIGITVFAILRSIDPECVDPREFGRSAILVAGCWFGGLGTGPALVGLGVWIVAYFLFMVGVWSRTRQVIGQGNLSVDMGMDRPVPVAPLAWALAVAMAASLIMRG